jgi:hypothetical protein
MLAIAMSHQTDSTLVEAVRAACLKAAIQAYEDAGISGLCAEGRWEAALAAMRQVDLSGAVERTAGWVLTNARRADGPQDSREWSPVSSSLPGQRAECAADRLDLPRVPADPVPREHHHAACRRA